ncbi:MAG: hypothetical protein CM15mP55_0460 [Hyphomicrobiales bacterium]|nr:MAG: hypothetical protein CM15mP55_0460 [Hyphomicrobiales bacterium]
MCGKYDRDAVGHLVNFIDKNRPFFQRRNNLTVMHNLVAHIYRRPVQVECALDNLDRAINAGTKSSWICQNEGFWRLSCFGHSLVSFKRVMSLQSGLRLTACLDNVCSN